MKDPIDIIRLRIKELETEIKDLEASWEINRGWEYSDINDNNKLIKELNDILKSLGVE